MEAEVPCVEVVYQRLVQLIARAFYASDLKVLFAEDESEKAPLPSERKKKQPADYTGLGAVVMDALLYRPWWEEEEFARKLGLPVRAVRQILRLLETHCLVAREHRKEKRRKKDGEEKEVDGQIDGDVVEESNQDRGNLISYCSLDYQRFFDMARFRIHRIHRKLKEELEDKRAVQEYLCPSCSKTYTTLQAPFLIKPDGLFHCEECNAVLETSAEGQADGMSRRERTKLVKAKQAKVSEELKPLTVLLAEIEKKLASGQQIPDFGTLAAWAESEARRTETATKRDSGGRQPGIPHIDIDLAGPSTQAASSDAAPRELPPWLQRQNGVQGTPASASLSQEVSGEFKDIKSASPEDEKKTEEDEVMRQFKERVAQMAAQDRLPKAKRQKTAEGWQEVKAEESGGGWQEVSVSAASDGAPKHENVVKEEPVNEQAAALPGAETVEDDEWEDA